MARELYPLAISTRIKNDPDFELFHAIDSETLHLPVGPVRENWAPHALAKEDEKIKAAEELWRERALEAAARLVERYKWAVKRVSTDPNDTNMSRAT